MSRNVRVMNSVNSPEQGSPSLPKRILPSRSDYQKNVSQPVGDKWYAGDKPTTAEALGQMTKLMEIDPERGYEVQRKFVDRMGNPSSAYYNPYTKPTNPAVAQMAELGFDTSNIDDSWFEQNNYLKQYYVTTANTNGLSSTMTNKKASNEQRAAYGYNQLDKQREVTSKAQTEISALREELGYMAKDQNHNYSDDYIIGHIDWKKYPTLVKMKETAAKGTPMELNAPVEMATDDWMHGVLWAARNDGGTGSIWQDIGRYALGEGNQWTDDPEINAKLKWNNENTYSPYSVGMTAGEEGRYFDVYEFTPEKIEELRATLDLNDATAMKMFDNVISAEETTVKAETERANLMEKVDDWISKGFSAEKIMEKVDGYLDKKCPTLRAMDKSMKSSDQKLLPTTRAIDYKYEDLKRYVEGRSKSPTNSGVEETNTVLSRAGETWTNKFSPQQIETDKSETAALMNDVAAVDEQLTPAEMAYMSNANSSYWGDMRDSWDELGGSLADGQPVSKEFALAQMEKADKEYTSSAFKSAEIITDYESKQKQYDAALAQYNQLSAQYGDQQYVGKQVLDSNVVEANINGKPVFLNMTIDPSTGEFVMSDAYFINSTGRLMKSNSQQFRDYVGNEEEWNKFAEEETSKYNTYAENVDRVNREGIQETEEGQEGLQQMYAAQALMEDAKAYLDKNKDAYAEAVKTELEARDKFARSYQLLDDHGVTTDGGKTHLAMFDFAISYGKQKPREKFGYSDVNQIDEILATDTEGKYSLPELMTVTRESIKEVDEQIADRQFLLEYFGDEIPQNYKNNILAQIADLEWDKKDREYFLLQDNKDWDEMVAKGLEENRPNLEFIDFSGGSRLPEHWANMTKEEIDRYHYILGRDGQKAADEYYAHLNENEMLGKRTMDNFRKWSQQLAKDNVALANLFAIGTAPISSISSLMGMIYSAATGKSANNTSLMAFNTFANEVNQATVQQIQEKFKDNPTAQKLVQGAYEIAYNRGRSAANAAFFGGLGAFNEFFGALPMAVSAMADKVMELKDDGATDAQAWLLGTVTLFCEAGTEMIELKHIKGAKELGLNNLTGIIDFLKQYPIAGLNEALGESLNDIVENFSDRIVMGDESEFNDRVWHYRTTMGMSKEDAEAMAWKDEIYNVMHTAIISFLSPGLDVLSFASGKTALYDHYRRQAKEYDMSIRDIRNAEQTKARYAEQEVNAEQPNSVPTLDVEGAERKIEDTKTYQTDMEILETAGQTTDPNAKSSAVAATLKTENTDAESDIANAAAMKIDETFENGVDEIQDLMQGGMVAEVDAVTLKKGIQYAALGGENSACNQVVNSEEYRNATPDVKAEMLADAVASDEQNQSVQESIRGAVRENHVAEQEAILIRNGALESVRKSAEAVKAAESNVRKAQDELEARQGEAEAAAQNLAAAVEKQNNDPSDENYKEVISAIAELGKRNESVKQYEEHLQKMNENADKARADLEQARNGSLADVRRQAEAIVDQNYQDRAVAEQQRAEQARKDADIAEQARKDAQELSNFSRLNAEELVDQQFPNISREDRARAIRIYMAVQAAMSSNVQSVQARKDFTEKLAKKYGLTVKEVPQQGNLFNAHIDPKTRTLYVNERTNQSDVMYAILIHEITHPAENAKELYTELADAVLQMKYGDGITYNGILAAMQNGDLTSRLAQDILGKKRIYDNALKKAHSYEEALQEIVADGVGYVIAGDQNAIDQIVAEKPNLARRILASIKNFIQRMAGIEGEPISQAQKIADMLEKSLEATWGGNQKNSINTTQALMTDNDGNEVATELPGGTVSVDRFSLNSFDAEERMRVADALRNAVDENGNRRFTEEEIYNYMSDAIGIASMIAADRLRLDFDADETKSMVKPNADYGISLDASTLCAKRLLYQGTFDEIQHLLPNTPLTPDDLIELANMMREMGYETPCGICYVESRRKTLGIETQKWLDSYTGDPEDSYIPKIEDLTTSDGLDRLSKEHPITHDNYLEAMKKLNQRNPKVVQLRTDYRGEIKDMSETSVQKAVNHGGVRVQSFSDFETPHLLDMIQVVYDMASKGLTSQAYTKVPNFAWAFGDTGMKINLSEIAKGDGYEIAGGLSFKDIASMPYEEAKKLISLLYDDVEGMKHSEAIALRNRYSKDVGTILVGKSDAHIIAAMADGEVDFIIPFHRSGWTKKERNLMETLRGYQDYTNDQNERKILMRKPNGKGYKTIPAAKSRIHNFEPVGEKTANGNGMNGYWDFSKSGRENAETYLRMCAEDKRIPKFSRFLVDNGDGSFSLPQGDDFRSTAIREGYWKTLIDFKMYDNDGNGSEQTAVTPNVNMPEAIRILNEYSLDRNGIRRENNNTNPVATPVVERFVEARKAREARNARNYEARMEQLQSRHSINSWNLDEEFDNMVSEMSTDELFNLLGIGNGNEEEARNVLTNAVQDLKKEFDPTIYNGRLYVKPETLNFWLSGGGFASSDPNYAQAYITMMNPADFLRMTTVSENGQQSILNQTETLDERKLSENAERQPIQLIIDEATGKIVGHEGRHRSVALSRAGVTQVPVLLFDTSTKYSKTPKDYITLEGQDYGDNVNGNTVTFESVVPLSGAYRDEIFQRFTASAEDEANAAENNQRILRYSLPSDAPYLSAVNHGDMEEAQRLVDKKAREAGYDTGYLFWRGDSEPYNVLEPGEGGNLGTGLYFTEQRSYAEKFARGGVLRKFYLKRTNGSDITGDGGFEDFREFQDQWLEENGYDPEDSYIEPEMVSEILDDYIAAHDFDYLEGTNVGGLAYGASETAVQNSWQAKLADPVTYDDNGEVIPLSERFNDQKEDIRYSLPSDDILEEQFRYAIENGGDIPTITQNINPAQDEKDRQWGIKGLQQSDEIAEQAKQYVLANNKYYPDTNSEQIDRAIEWIRSQRSERDPDGYNTAFRKVTSPNFNYRSADGQAQIIAMMGMAVARGDVPGQVQLADTYNKQGTVLGQALQARKLWKMMTPEGRIGSLQKMLDNAQAELTKRGINMDLTFSNWVYMAATAATEDGDMQRVYQMAGQELAKQIPANWRDKLRSIRMLSMLGNPRTHIRNIVGNALFVPAVGLKNKLGALMELGKKPGERTKTTSLFLSNEARAFAQEDVKRMKDELTGEAKYNEMNAYQKEQKAFKGLLQAVIDYNSNKLEAEDWKFLRGHYIRALGGWMMANGYTAEQLNNDAVLLEKGRSYAIEEAKKATYRDFSKMAATLNEVSRKGGVAGFIVDAVLPFKKTPANILKRGIEYSPIGLMRSFTTDLYHMKQWNDAQAGKLAGIPEKALSPTQWIDKLCSGLSGTAIMGIGALLSSMGLVTCGLTDDDDEIEKDKGAQQYAIKILGTDITYTMDWAAPMSMPFFVGAAVHEQLHSEKGFNVEDIVDALGNISEPVFNLSMLDGVNTLFKTSQYDDTNTITQIGAKIGSNYVTSYVPSVLGAITRILADDTRRRAYVESGKGTGVLGTVRYAWEQTENKLPGLSRTNIPYRDVWGNPEKSQSFGESDILGFAERLIENLISPGYISRTKDDPLLNEMGRLYDSTHDSSMIPSDPPKSFKYDGKPYVLTDKQWDAYKVARGQAAFNGLTELMSMPDYRNAEDSVQVQMINKVWDYADKVGKAAIVPNYVMENMGENPVASIANDSKVSGYENRMIQALNLGDYEAYETMIEALHEADVEDSAIKTKIGNAYRTKYQKAYINDDFATMAEIEDILDNTDFDFDLDEWEEKAEKKYSR